MSSSLCAKLVKGAARDEGKTWFIQLKDKHE